jgi:hypothetical protein
MEKDTDINKALSNTLNIDDFFPGFAVKGKTKAVQQQR